MNCIRIPLSLEDATAIVECAGGPDWRTPFMYGLGTLAVVGLLIVGTFLLLRGALAR